MKCTEKFLKCITSIMVSSSKSITLACKTTESIVLDHMSQKIVYDIEPIMTLFNSTSIETIVYAKETVLSMSEASVSISSSKSCLQTAFNDFEEKLISLLSALELAVGKVLHVLFHFASKLYTV
jgi:hypothetical protein